MALEKELEAELVDNKEQVFKRPTTLKEIIRGRNEYLTISSFEDIISVLETKKQDEIAIIQSEVEIIPKNQYNEDIYYSAQNFSKRGPLVQLDTLNGILYKLKEEKWGPTKARIEASKSETYKNSQEHYAGWLWFDPKRTAHVLHPTTVIEGHRIQAYALKSMNIQEKIEFPNPRFYHANDSKIKTVRVLVPSRTEKKHSILMENLTDPEDSESFVQWTRFNTRHKCKHKEEDFSFRFRDYVTYCPHDVAAHAAYSRKIAEETGKIILQPFPLFRESILRLYLSLAYDTVKTEQKIENNKIKTKQRALTLAEIDPIIMYAWLNYKNFNTFYVPAPSKGYKKMSQYNWAKSGDGIKIKDD